MNKKLILYAEDDMDDRFIFENSFARHRDDVDILMFMDGLDLINYLKSDIALHPNLIVLDINMPQINGKDALRILRNIPSYSKTPVVLLTTSSSPIDRYFAQHFNAGFITKPMDENEMEKVTKKLLHLCKVGETPFN